MGSIAASLSSKVIFTSDNPRDEEPDKIIQQITAGVNPLDFKKIMCVTLERKNVKVACQMSKPGDIILIAGKGHENYQEIKGKDTLLMTLKLLKKYFPNTLNYVVLPI